MTRTNHAPTTRRHRRKPKGFWIHLSVFVLVNAGLVTLNLVRSPEKLWSRWVLLGWGAGILLHGFLVFWCRTHCEPKKEIYNPRGRK